MSPRTNASPGEALGSAALWLCRLAWGTSYGDGAEPGLVHGEPDAGGGGGGGAAGLGAPAAASGFDSLGVGGGGALGGGGGAGGVWTGAPAGESFPPQNGASAARRRDRPRALPPGPPWGEF